MDQRKILKIVRKWEIKSRPEYREFRCAGCQRKIRKAWHIWLHTGGFRLEVHLCRKCFKELKKR